MFALIEGAVQELPGVLEGLGRSTTDLTSPWSCFDGLRSEVE